ncbi:unnamed protein product, partial [Gulo gulo]
MNPQEQDGGKVGDRFKDLSKPPGGSQDILDSNHFLLAGRAVPPSVWSGRPACSSGKGPGNTESATDPPHYAPQ